MRYDSHQRDFFSVLPAVLRDRCLFVRFANCKDKPTALCKHAVGTERTVPASRSRERASAAIKVLLPNAKQICSKKAQNSS